MAIAVVLGRMPRRVHLDLLGLKRDVGVRLEMGGRVWIRQCHKDLSAPVGLLVS